MIGNPHVRERLDRLIEAGRVGHAYLFTGPEGVGKLEVALEFGRRLGRIDRVELEEGKAAIPIARVRALIRSLALTSDETRVVVIEPADRMTEEAMNALLKLLEEPPERVVLILVTAAPAGVLPTIRSRCQAVLFFPVPEPQIREYIRAKGSIGDEDLDLVVTLASGSPARADRVVGDLEEEKGRVESLFEALKGGSIDSLIAAKQTADQRDKARRALAVLAAALRDRLAGRDTPLSRRLPKKVDALQALDEVLRHEILLGRNTHVGLTLENALLKL